MITLLALSFLSLPFRLPCIFFHFAHFGYFFLFLIINLPNQLSLFLQVLIADIKKKIHEKLHFIFKTNLSPLFKENYATALLLHSPPFPLMTMTLIWYHYTLTLLSTLYTMMIIWLLKLVRRKEGSCNKNRKYTYIC